MTRTRVLGIAPYEGMRNLMVQLAQTMEDIELTAFVGDLEPGAAIAERYTAEDFDVVLSRGGTAELIRQKTRLPVIDIELSVYDILRSIRLAESGNNRYAIVGFPAITRNASFLCDVLRYEIDLYTIHDEDEARAALQKLAREGCSMVLCDMITNSLAREYGIPAILIISGKESIETALRQAVSISKVFQPLQEHVAFLDKLLMERASDLTVLDESGNKVYCTLKSAVAPKVEKRMHSCLPAVLKEGGKRSILTVDSKQYVLIGKRLAVGEARYAAFSIQESNTHPMLEKYGIRYLDKEEAFDHFFNSFYGVTQPATAQLYERYAQSTAPLMIVGEMGTGKDQMARLLYGKGRFQNAPLCLIDCALLKQKGWNHLMANDLSPLTDTGITLHFRNVEALEEGQFLQLFMTIRDTHVHQRNRLMFSCAVQEDGALPQRSQQLLSWFGCTVLALPALRTHKEDIPQLTSLYISLLNMRNAKEIAGIEPEALQLLTDYEWPANYDQFKRALHELVLATESPYILTETVQKLLTRERAMFPKQTAQPLAEALRGKTLEEIEMLAVRQALSDENGNQRATAARLGISRTTLWRMLQKETQPQAR